MGGDTFLPAIDGQHAAERHEDRSHAERGIEDSVLSCNQQPARRGAAPSAFPRGAWERGFGSFLQSTASSPRSGTKRVPTRSVGTRIRFFLAINSQLAAERHQARSHAERGNDDSVLSCNQQPARRGAAPARSHAERGIEGRCAHPLEEGRTVGARAIARGRSLGVRFTDC